MERSVARLITRRWIALLVAFAACKASTGGGDGDVASHSLAVSVVGSGSVISAPPGIDCGSDCTEGFAAGTEVTLTATPAAGATFAGWSGGGCSGRDGCVLTLSSATGVTATFTPAGSSPEECGNAVDDDGDGNVDCADHECAGDPGCTTTVKRVGPTRTYATPAAVAGTLQAGDLVLIDGDQSYSGGMVIDASGTPTRRIIVRGERVNGLRPVIDGGWNCVEINGDYVTVEGLDITNCDKSGIGVYGHEIIVRDVVVHDFPHHGLLGYGSGTGDVVVEYSEFHHTGQSPRDHQIYMATDEYLHPGATFRLQFTYIHDGLGGNNVKSRSQRNELYYNWIEGAGYHGMELIGIDPEDNGSVGEGTAREDSDVVGNVVVCSAGNACVRAGGDGTGASHGRYRLVNNTFLCESSCDVVRIYDDIETLELHNNAIYNLSSAGSTTVVDEADAAWEHGRMVTGSNNWVQAGTSSVPGPSEWSGTVAGGDPGFLDVDSYDISLTATSPLRATGNPAPASFSSYPFPAPMFPPAYGPPSRAPMAVGSAVARSLLDDPPRGAFE